MRRLMSPRKLELWMKEEHTEEEILQMLSMVVLNLYERVEELEDKLETTRNERGEKIVLLR